MVIERHFEFGRFVVKLKIIHFLRQSADCVGPILTAKRADKVAGGGLVMADIDLFIRESEFIICDLSNERPNVYYELGYAHGAGNISKNTLLIAKKIPRFISISSSLRIEPYSDIAELRSILATKLELLSGRRDFGPRAKEPSSPNFPSKVWRV